MTGITIRFEGVSEKILESITKSGLAKSKSEAIRLALFEFALQHSLINDKSITEFLQAQAKKNPITPEALFEEVERVKTATIRR